MEKARTFGTNTKKISGHSTFLYEENRKKG
jgi:hypothetical protein